MQVTHERDHITHAVIGGSQTIDFGISNNAEFFNILSSTLYRDQMLAVVREVLCNAWDAHIEAGCTDIPIEVSFDNDKFIVRDFGKGIHKNDIGPIYGTYGNSTKKNDGKQTGGFGLGCKAPFAYTEHFEVISHHQGEMTIYAMSKSSAEVNGKPGITPIMSAPTTSTGLQVSIKIKSNSDRIRFNQLVRTIAFNGDMHVILDGRVLDTINFPKNSNYLITDNEVSQSNHIIFVRYGNVIYPVESNEQIFNNLRRVKEILSKVGNYTSGYQIIFQAPPHSIAVTPSRESLSMQEHTCNTLNNLFETFIDGFEQKLNKAIYVENKLIFENETPKTLPIPVVASREKTSIFKNRISRIRNISTIEDFSKQYLINNYPSGWSFRKHDLTQRIKFLIKHGSVDKGLAYTFLRQLNKKDLANDDEGFRYYRDDFESNKWFLRRVITPIIKRMEKTPLISLDNLFVCDSKAESSKKKNRMSDARSMLVPATNAKFYNQVQLFPYIRNIVVLAYSRMRVVSEGYFIDKNQEKVYTGSGFLVYIVPRKKNALEDARKFFNATNMDVIDFTTTEEERIEYETPRSKVVKKPRRKGYPTLNNVISKSVGISLHSLKDNENLELITEPEMYLRVYLRKDEMNCIRGFEGPNYKLLFKRYGAKCAVVTTSAQEEAMMAKKIPSFTSYVSNEVMEKIKGNALIENYWGSSLSVLTNYHLIQTGYDKERIFKFIYKHPFLKQACGINNPLPEEETEIVTVFKLLLNKFSYFSGKDELIKLCNTLDALPIDNALVNLSEKVKNSEIGVLDIGNLDTLISNETDVTRKMKLYDMFLNLLNW